MRSINVVVALTLAYSVLCASGQNMYCGRRECYDILGLRGYETSATTAQIKRVYRQLSLQYHPDKNSSPDAADIFQEIATAYETLSNPLTRQAYDHYLNNPDDHAYNYSMHVYHVYAPKSDYRLITIGFLVFLSIVQYLAQSHRYKQALSYFRQSDEVRRKAQKILSERALDENNVKSKRIKDKKLKKEQTRAELEEIIDELMENLEISGGYGKPSLSSLLIARLAVLPFTIGSYILWRVLWWYRYSYNNQPYSLNDAQYLTCKALGIAEEYFLSDQFVEDRQELIQREIWIPENMQSYQKDLEQRWKKKHPKKYKQMLACRRRAGVPDLEPEVSDCDYDSD